MTTANAAIACVISMIGEAKLTWMLARTSAGSLREVGPIGASTPALAITTISSHGWLASAANSAMRPCGSQAWSTVVQICPAFRYFTNRMRSAATI